MKSMLLFGMATHLTKLVRSADVKQEIDLLREAGVTAIRTGFLWDRIEPVEGELHFDPVDEVVDLLRAAGIEILGTIARTPIWAGGDEKDGCFRFHPPGSRKNSPHSPENSPLITAGAFRRGRFGMNRIPTISGIRKPIRKVI